LVGTPALYSTLTAGAVVTTATNQRCVIVDSGRLFEGGPRVTATAFVVVPLDDEVAAADADAATAAIFRLATTDPLLKSMLFQYVLLNLLASSNSRFFTNAIAHELLNDARNLIGGQKEDLTDSRNVNHGRDFTCDIIADIALAKDGDKTVDGKVLHLKKGIEVGNVFQLGRHYSSLMKGAEYVSEKGEKVPYYMGCYGIGVGRTLAAVIEVNHDDRGIVWPESTAPYKFHLIGLDMQDESIKSKVHKVYKALLEKYGDEVLFDDRDARAGEKFADADLIGCPIRLVVGKKSGDQVEMKKRGEKESALVDVTDL
jgi:prolyl-tRNA synthetase